MASQGTGYDLSTSTYSPDGRLFQVEYALKAVENAGTAIGIRTPHGVVLAVEKLVTSKLLVPRAPSNRRIFSVDTHLGLATAGLIADGRHMAGRAREEAENFRDNFHEPIRPQALAARLSQYADAYTLYSSVRPFGISTIVGGLDPHTGKPGLYTIEPSGEFRGYRATAIGKGRQLAKTELEKIDWDTITLNQAVERAAEIIYKVHDDAKDKDFELELSWIGPETKGKHQLVPLSLAQVRPYSCSRAGRAANPSPALPTGCRAESQGRPGCRHGRLVSESYCRERRTNARAPRGARPVMPEAVRSRPAHGVVNTNL